MGAIPDRRAITRNAAEKRRGAICQRGKNIFHYGRDGVVHALF